MSPETKAKMAAALDYVATVYQWPWQADYPTMVELCKRNFIDSAGQDSELFFVTSAGRKWRSDWSELAGLTCYPETIPFPAQTTPLFAARDAVRAFREAHPSIAGPWARETPAVIPPPPLPMPPRPREHDVVFTVTSEGTMELQSAPIIALPGDRVNITLRNTDNELEIATTLDVPCGSFPPLVLPIDTRGTDRSTPSYTRGEDDTTGKLITERASRYGDFTDGAAIMQALKLAMHAAPSWPTLAPWMRESLEMIVHKIGRVLNGNSRYLDSWDDIIGYARLVVEQLEREGEQR